MPSLDWLVHDRRQLLLFSSDRFLLLLSLFVAVWAALRGRHRLRLGWLLGFSYYYYYRCNGVLVLVLCGVTLADWAIGLQLERTRSPAARRLWLTVGIALNLSLLGFFKYTGFLLQQISLATGARIDPIDLFLPIGISFHVFQSVSYLVDVYRRRFKATRSLFEYALFLSFFPQVVAGPIVRAGELLPQLRQPHEPDPHEIGEGLFRVVLGVAKKALLADYLARYVDLVFAAPGAYSGFELLLGVYAYAGQIYFDFSGYSDMALGFARILGVRLPENFASPYRATSITDFWRRWHMSLSRWLRDYLFVPLCGSRPGQARRYLALLITMLLAGLWHGAGWIFVAWGGLHGLALAAERFEARLRRAPAGRWRVALGWLLTFHLVAVLWVLFRAASFELCWQVLGGIGAGWEPARVAAVLGVRRWLVLAVVAGLGLSVLPPRWRPWLEARFGRVPWPVQALLLVGVLEAAGALSSSELTPFIYFQF